MSTKPSRTDVAAAVLMVFAVAVVVVSLTTTVLGSWGPNMATSAVTVAVTIAVIDRLIRREATDRLAARTEPVLEELTTSFCDFIRAVAFDYVLTHSKHQETPEDALEMIDLWLAEHDTEDTPRSLRDDSGLPALLREARSYVDLSQRTRDRNLDILTPELVAAIDRFAAGIEDALSQQRRVSDTETSLGRRDEAMAIASAVRAARKFAMVLGEEAPAQFWEIPVKFRAGF